MTEKVKYKVLVVDDESSNIMALTHILSPEHIVYAAKSGQAAIKAAVKHQPDVILLDILMPEMDGYAVIATLKSSGTTQNIPIIFISGLNNAGDEEKGLALGAADYISKPFSPAIVKLRLGNQIKILDQMRVIERQSMTDQLTDMPNRRAFDNRLNLEWSRAYREQTPVSLLVIDADNFKKYNDTYGHPQGDTALQALAKILQQTVKRPGDFAARWGGEEFIALLSNTDADGALAVAEEIRKNVEDAVIPSIDAGAAKITVSIGISTNLCRHGSSNTITELLAKADNALYEAKRSGKNRVCHYQGLS